MASAAAVRFLSLNASRALSAAARRSAFEGLARICLCLPSSLQKRHSTDKDHDPKKTGPHADSGVPVFRKDQAPKNRSAKPRTPLKHSIPEFPTKVGGHHMSGSTDPARDSSLKDR